MDNTDVMKTLLETLNSNPDFEGSSREWCSKFNTPISRRYVGSVASQCGIILRTLSRVGLVSLSIRKDPWNISKRYFYKPIKQIPIMHE